MPRFIPVSLLSRMSRWSQFRLVSTAVLGAVLATAVIWPLASIWSSRAQSRLVAASSNASSPSRGNLRGNLLAKLTATDSRESRREGDAFLSAQTRETAAMLVPTITATMTDQVFTDVDGDGRADPGDTLRYTVTINNAGTDASNMIYTDTIDANTTLVAGSVNTTPIAANDTYSVSGNIQISIAQAAGVIVNDFDPDTGNNTGLTVSGPVTTTQGGTLALSANGSFTYNPAPGFEGADTFTYTLTDPNGGSSTGTATLNVSGMIWFVNVAAAGGGDGRLSTPFNCLTGAGCYNGSANDPSDNLFIFSGAYTGGITLKNNQRVIGAGAGASISTITGINPPTGSLALPPTGGANPTITTVAAATSAFTLASGNTIRGLTIGNTTAADIVGSAFGTLTVAEVTLNGTGRALDLNNGTLAATFQSITSTSSSTQGMALQSCAGSLTSTGGTTISGSTTQGILVSASTANITFNNTSVTPGSDGVSLQNNSSGTRSFGTLSITNGTGAGFLHTGGGGLTTISGATAITNPSGRGIDIQNATASNGVTFAAVIATQSGGTGVNLQNNAGAITFGDLDITPDSGQRGLFSSGSTGTLTTTDGTINAPSAVAVEINGVSAASRTPLAIVFTSVSTTGGANGIVLTSTSGTFAVNGTGTTAGTGGTLQNITNRGGSFIDANGITLKNMNLTNVGTVNGADPTNANSTCGSLANGLGGNLGCNAGLHIVNVVGITIDRLVLNGGVQEGINGNNVTSFNMSNSSVLNFGDQTRECGVQFKNLVGTAGQPSTISSSTITGNEMDQLLVQNNSGTLTSFTVSASTLGTSVAPNGTAAIQFIGDNTANMTMSVTGSTLSNNATDGFFSTGANSAVVNPTVSGCTIQNNINSAVNISIQDSGNSTFNVLNNPTITGSGGNAININLALPSTGILQGTISGNTIGTAGVAGSGAGGTGHGVRIVSNGSGQIRTNITNNTIREVIFGGGINILTRDGSSDINATVTGNVVSPNNVNADTAILATSGATATDTGDMCADIGGAGALSNNVSNNNTVGLDEVRVRQRFLTTFRLPGYGGGATDTAAIAAFLAARNNVNGGTTSAGAGTYGGGAACTPPSFAGDFTATTSYETLKFDSYSTITPMTDAAERAKIATRNISGGDQPSSERLLANHASMNGTETLLTEVLAARHTPQDDKRPVAPVDTKQQQERITVRVTKPDKNARIQSGETITVGAPTGFTLPAAKSITITFRVTIDNVVGLTQVSNQGTVSGSNFANVLTDDPAVAGAANPTVRAVDNTTVAVASNANPSVFGQNVTFTATMTGVPARASDPPGTVQFKADGNNIGAAVPVVVGAVGDNVSTAQASISSLSVANHVITAQYSGGGSGATGYNANNGTLAGGQVVNKANTTTGVTSSQNPSVFGQPVTFTATVAVTAPGAGSPSGTINFLDGVTPIVGCQNVALQTAQAQCQPGSLSVGNHTITTTYSGDGNFNTSNGSLTGNPQVVNKANTSVGLVSSQNPAPQGTNITFTATLAVTPPGAGTPTGTVQFRDGANPITGCSAVAVSAGQAQCMTNALTPGNHTISAVYSGDGSFNTSTGNLTGNPQVITGPPVITPAVGLSRTQGSAASNSQIATVSDDVAAPGSITVTTQTVPTGITVTNIVNTNGTITADLAAGCSAATGNNTVVLLATDGKALSQTANLTINVITNPAPTLGTYTNSSIVLGCRVVFTPTAAPADNGSVANVTAQGSAGFTGTISVNQTTGEVTITNSGPVNPHTITVTVTDNCGLTFQRQVTLTVVAPPTARTPFDFDGDRKSDLAVYRPGATASDPSFWFILRSSDNTFQFQQFGADNDVIVPGDYDGDGDTDFGIYRPSTNTWFTTLNPATNYGAFVWGVAGDIPVPGYYDADNKMDIAVFRPSNGNWYIAKSTGGSDVINWGLAGDKPVPADYNGDGTTDVAQYRETAFNYIIRLSGGGSSTINWGTTGDKLVPADYDGDGKADIAVYRPSNAFWYILQSSGGTRSELWGLPGNDVPVPADYDNDGKADLAVFRPSNSTWFIFNSCPCTLGATQWGVSTDKPVQTAYIP